MIALFSENDLRPADTIAKPEYRDALFPRDRRAVGEPEFLRGDRFDPEFLQDLCGHNRIDRTRIDKKIERTNVVGLGDVCHVHLQRC